MFKKLIFIDNSSIYFSGELTTEAEKNLSRWVTQNIAINEDAITRIILMSLNKFIIPSEALDILEQLLKRNGDSVYISFVFFFKKKKRIKTYLLKIYFALD